MGWKQGNVVMEARPYAHVIAQKFRDIRCSFCLNSAENLRKCGACKSIWYCGSSCQKGDWKVHKTECGILRRVPHLPADSIRLYLRLLIRHLDGAASLKDEQNESPCIRSFNDLMSHSASLKADKPRLELFEIASDFLRAYTHGILQLPGNDTLLDIFGKMVINTFTVVDEQLQDVGVAIYSSPSVFDHCCKPNAVASFEGRKVVIRAVTDIPSSSLSDVLLCYIDPVSTTLERQQQLQEQYYFQCRCDACKDTQMEALVMSVEGANQDDVDCVKICLKKLEEMEKSQVSAEECLAVCEACLDQVHLPDMNVYLTRLRSRAFDLAIQGQIWETALRIGKLNIHSYSMMNAAFSPSVGYLHANLGKLLMFLDELQDGVQHLVKAEKIFAVCLSEGHPLYGQVRVMLEQAKAELACG